MIGITNYKEELSMKTAAFRRRLIRFNTYSPYPNAATGRQMLDRLLNLLLVAACGMGIAAMILFMLVLL